MTDKEVYTLLKDLNIPVAYDHFVKKVSPPFLLYREDIPSTFKADDKTYKKTNKYIVWLITEVKNVELEENLESLFNDNYIPYDKDSDYIDDEKIYQIEYSI